MIKHIATHQRRPVFEIEQWPDSELEWWAAFFSIDLNKDKPKINLLREKDVSDVKDEIAKMKQVLAL